eukprot:10538658-Lingulodinium_polyedra.AAC.1
MTDDSCSAPEGGPSARGGRCGCGKASRRRRARGVISAAGRVSSLLGGHVGLSVGVWGTHVSRFYGPYGAI